LKPVNIYGSVWFWLKKTVVLVWFSFLHMQFGSVWLIGEKKKKLIWCGYGVVIRPLAGWVVVTPRHWPPLNASHSWIKSAGASHRLMLFSRHVTKSLIPRLRVTELVRGKSAGNNKLLPRHCTLAVKVKSECFFLYFILTGYCLVSKV
jgi:hypothetical protein